MTENPRHKTYRRTYLDAVNPKVAVKWSKDTLREGFLPFPKKLLRCATRLFQGSHRTEHLIVVLAVADARRDTELPRSYDFLAFSTGMSEAEFRQRAIELQKLGLLEINEMSDRVEIDHAPLMKRIEELTVENSEAGEPQ